MRARVALAALVVALAVPALAIAPVVVTGVASSVVANGAQLNGTVNPGGEATTALFEYGLTTGYGQTVDPGSPGSGSSPVAVQSTVGGLDCETTYHFRLTATNSSGTTNGDDATFTTSACPAPETPAWLDPIVCAHMGPYCPRSLRE